MSSHFVIAARAFARMEYEGTGKTLDYNGYRRLLLQKTRWGHHLVDFTLQHCEQVSRACVGIAYFTMAIGRAKENVGQAAAD